jgi:hypothetical protein
MMPAQLALFDAGLHAEVERLRGALAELQGTVRDHNRLQGEHARLMQEAARLRSQVASLTSQVQLWEMLRRTQDLLRDMGGQPAPTNREVVQALTHIIGHIHPDRWMHGSGAEVASECTRLLLELRERFKSGLGA